MDTNNFVQTPQSPQRTTYRVELELPEFDTPQKTRRLCVSDRIRNIVSPIKAKQEEDTRCAHALLKMQENIFNEQCNSQNREDERDVEEANFYDTEYVSGKEAISISKTDDKCLGIFHSGEKYVTRTVRDGNTPWYAFDNVNWKYIRCWIRVKQEFKPVMARLDTAKIVHCKRGCVRRVYSWDNGWKIKVHHATCTRRDTSLCTNCIRKRHCHKGSVILRIEGPCK